MIRRLRTLAALAAAAVVMTVAPALAHPPAFQANLTTDAEVADVVGSNANGHATFRLTDDGIVFSLKANRLSGPAWGAHIHGPADPGQNAGIVVGLCGAPVAAPVDECTMTKDGKLRVDGVITADLLPDGMSLSDLVALMASGRTYVNVHTDLNPGGEVRGQIR